VNVIFKFLYRLYRLFSRLHRWAQRRYTPAGQVVWLVCLISASVGIDTENTVTYQAFALLLGLLLVGTCGSLFFRTHFAAIRLAPRLGTVGQPLQYRVRLRNLTSKPQPGLSLLEDLADPRPSFKDWLAVQLEQEKLVRSFRFNALRRTNPFKVATSKEAFAQTLLPYQETEVPVELTPLRRGLLHFTGLTVARPDPLGLVRAMRKVALPHTVLVLPKRYRLPPIALPGTMKYQPGGVALASSVGQSEDFVALRDYRHGDPLRHIHWRSWARAGKPVVKEFEDEFFVRHALVLDTFIPQNHSELFEEAVAVAASFACTIDTQESLLDLLFVGPQSFCFTAGRGLAHTDQMLQILASVRPCQDKPFSSLEHLLLNHINVVSGCIFVLLAWDGPRQDLIRKLMALGVPLLVLVLTGPGQAKTFDPGPLGAQLERFHVLELGQIRQQLAQLS
jgi:uncharacterized protein (DUF58 family)